MPPGELNDWLDLWSTIFADDDPAIVTMAVKDLIQTHTGFPPEIADVRQKITEIIRTATGEPTDEESWGMLVKACSNGTWGSEEEFSKLPPELQYYCGSPSWIRDHARMDVDTLNTVVHGQFLKQYPVTKRAYKDRQNMNPELLKYIDKIFGRIPGEEKPSPNALNEQRNLTIKFLDGEGAK